MAGKQHVFIVGSKGIPASYGGFETFVAKLTQYKKSPRIQYHVAVLSDHTGEYMHNGARCFCVKVPDIGSAKAVYYDGAALDAGIAYCKKHPEIRRPIFYVLACRIGTVYPLLTGSRSMRWAGSSSSIRTAMNGSGQMERAIRRVLETFRKGNGAKRGPAGLRQQKYRKIYPERICEIQTEDDLYRLRLREQSFCAGR